MMNQNNYTEQQKIEILRRLRDTKIKSKEDLDNYIRYYFGVYLAKIPMEEGNSSPLDFVWDIYNTAMHGDDKCIYNFLGLAARGAQKSLSCGVLETLLLTHDESRDFFHMASIRQQSKVTYSYVQKFFKKPILAETIEKCLMSETKSRFDKQLIMGTGTMDSVNSFHGSVIQDEVDLTPPAVFSESKGMLTAQNGKLALNVCISSRKFAFGNVQALLDSLNVINRHGIKTPLKVHKWTILEVTEKCKDDRSGNYGIPYYIREDFLETRTQVEFDNISNSDKFDKYEKVIGYENCKECGIFAFCKGNLKKQDETNKYLQPIEQVRSLFFTDDLFFFLSQRLNKQPSSKGKVFPMWDESSHVKTYSEMLSILTGKPSDNKQLSLNELVDEFYKYNCRSFIGVDYGFNTAVALLAFVDGSDRIYIVDEIVVSGQSDAEFAFQVNKQWGSYRKTMESGFGDVASPQGIKEFSRYFPMISNNTEYNKLSKIPEYRASLIRRNLKSPGKALVKMYISWECGELRSEMPLYHYKIDLKTEEPTETIEKKNDHSIDSLGNILVGVFGIESDVAMVSNDIDDNINVKQLPISTPTLQEVVEFAGRNDFIDNSSDYSDDKDNEDDDEGGSDVLFDFA